MGLFDLFQAKNKSEDVKKHTLVVVDWDSCKSTQDFQFLLKIADPIIFCFTRRPQDSNLDQLRQLVKCTVQQLPEYESSLPIFLSNSLMYELQTNRVYKHVIIVSGTSQYQGTIAFLKEKRQSAELINLQPALRGGNDRRNNSSDRKRPDSRNNPRSSADTIRHDNRQPREETRNSSFDRGHDKIADRYNERVDRFQEMNTVEGNDRSSYENDRNNRRNSRPEQASSPAESTRNKIRPQENRPSDRPNRDRPANENRVNERTDSRSNDHHRNNAERRNENADRPSSLTRQNERSSPKPNTKTPSESYSRKNTNDATHQTTNETGIESNVHSTTDFSPPKPRPTNEAKKNVLRAANLPYYAGDTPDNEHQINDSVERNSAEFGTSSESNTHFTPKTEELQAIVDYFNQHFHVGSTYQKTLFGMVVKQATNKTTVEVLNSKNAKPLIIALLHNGCIEELDDQNFKVIKEAELEMLFQRPRHRSPSNKHRNPNRRSFQSKKPRSSSRTEESVM